MKAPSMERRKGGTREQILYSIHMLHNIHIVCYRMILAHSCSSDKKTGRVIWCDVMCTGQW